MKAGEALADPYLSPYHDPTDEPEAEEKFDWSFNDADLPVDTWKIMMCVCQSLLAQKSSWRLMWNLRYSEILDYHNVDSANGDQAENGDS